jgi:hypothetical protein
MTPFTHSLTAALPATAARLYQGQTTNVRTPVGGFSPVYAGPHVSGQA